MNLKIKATPRIAEKLNLEGKGFEDLYWIGNHIMLDNGYDSIILKKSMNGGIYRKLEENPGDDVSGVVHISTYSPTDFKVHVDYFQLLEDEKPDTKSFPITDPLLIQKMKYSIMEKLDSLSPEEMENLQKILAESMKELREKEEG